MKEEILSIAIYAIDDEEGQRIAIDKLFNKNNIYNYTIFSDPVALLESLYKGVQICVLDYNLKNEFYNGLTLMEEILRHNSYCKCIIMSGYSDFDLIKAFLNGGAFRYLTKGEDNFGTHLINYINDALVIVNDAFEFYSTVLTSMKGVTNELKEVKNG